jgi:hypothetical protein
MPLKPVANSSTDSSSVFSHISARWVGNGGVADGKGIEVDATVGKETAVEPVAVELDCVNDTFVGPGVAVPFTDREGVQLIRIVAYRTINNRCSLRASAGMTRPPNIPT